MLSEEKKHWRSSDAIQDRTPGSYTPPEQFVALSKERPETLVPSDYIAELKIVRLKIKSRTLIILALLGVVASALLAALGVWLLGNSQGHSTVDVVGLFKVDTSVAGVALTALGVAGVFLSIRRVL